MRSEEDEPQLAMASLEGHLRSNGNPDIHARKPCKRRLSERYLLGSANQHADKIGSVVINPSLWKVIEPSKI
jgi:hypothetical protein